MIKKKTTIYSSKNDKEENLSVNNRTTNALAVELMIIHGPTPNLCCGL